PIPYYQSVCLSVGYMVKIKANFQPLVGRKPELVVEFCTGIGKDSDIAFHFRLYNSMVVMNSFQDGKWQEEKRVSSDNFVLGESFELRFLVLDNGYQVFVNNKSILIFVHCLPLQSVKMLKVSGDIVLTSVETL
ncbi:hypothetical protein Celaphus_00004410, partial [Cervus elaphus hippelaphus]